MALVHKLWFTRVILLSTIVLSLALVFVLGYLLHSEVKFYVPLNTTTAESPSPMHIEDVTPLLEFNASYAVGLDYYLCDHFPGRMVGTPNGTATREWIRSLLVSYGWDESLIHEIPFDVWVRGERKSGTDIYLESPGGGGSNAPEVMVVSAHYDVPEPGSPGAMDDGTGVATVLELARVFANTTHNRTMVFLFSDSEEYGHFWGAVNFARHYDKVKQIVSLFDLDYIDARNISALQVSATGLHQGYTPLWLRTLVEFSARQSVDYPTVDDTGVMEYLNRAIMITFADYGVYLEKGMNAVNVGTRSVIPNNEYHTHKDVCTPERLPEENFRAYGRTVEHLLRTIDMFPQVPEREPMYYFRSGHGSYLSGMVTYLVQAVAVFLPLLAAIILSLLSIFSRSALLSIKTQMRVAVPQIISLLGWFVSWAIGYGVLKILLQTKVIPRYEMYPATPNDSFLLHPPRTLLAAVICGVFILPLIIRAILYAIVRWASNRRTVKNTSLFSVGSGEFEVDAFHRTSILVKSWATAQSPSAHRRFVLLCGLLFIEIYIFVGNGFTATSLLLLPCYLWPMVGPRDQLIEDDTAINRDRRRDVKKNKILRYMNFAFNALLVVLGAAPFLTVVIYFSILMPIGDGFWYMTLGAAYGLFHVHVTLTFCFCMALFFSWLGYAWSHTVANTLDDSYQQLH